MQPTSNKNAARLSFSPTAAARPDGPPPPSIYSGGHTIHEKAGPRDKHYPEELRDLIGGAGIVRQRILANRSLDYWLACLNWILGALILAAAISPQLRVATFLAAIFTVIGAGASFVVAWRKGPSIYAAACRLDAAAGLQDRLSTTVHFAADEPSWMVLHQRRDALARLKGVNARALFPLHMPTTARRTATLALIAAGLFVYRIQYGPPVETLIQKTAQTHLAKAVISPLARAIENGLPNVLDRHQPDVLDEEAAALGRATQDEKKVDQLPPIGLPDGYGLDKTGQQNAPSLHPPNPGDADAARGQNQTQSDGRSSPDLQQQNQDTNAANQDTASGANAGKPQMGNQAQSNGQGSKGGQQSLAQKVMQALKNMVENMTGQGGDQSPGRPSQDMQGPSAQGQNGQPSETSGRGGQQAGLNNSPPKETPGSSGAHTGAGNGTQTPSTTQIDQNSSRRGNDNLIPERVQLDASDFRVQTRPRAVTGPGGAEVPLTNASPRGPATTNGAEQENIPLRYREYVQHYFDQRQK